jgi:hypothetical protein
MDMNILMDGSVVEEPWHPCEPWMKRDYSELLEFSTRTERPPRYFLIDFGISRRYDPKKGPPLEVPIWGGDKTVPEFQNSDDPCDPFPTDVYYIGNMIRQNFIEVRKYFSNIFYNAFNTSYPEKDRLWIHRGTCEGHGAR